MVLGIGVITCRRDKSLKRTIRKIEEHTKSPYYLLVADDNGYDIEKDVCLKASDISYVAGPNRGVCWNKNRALFSFIRYSDADPILIIEDDCYPIVDNWEQDWIKASKLFHHVNYANIDHWPKDWCRGGKGTPADPWLTWEISGYATITTRNALLRVGYLNTRFKGYGYGHIEWTERFCKAQYMQRNYVPCIQCGLEPKDEGSFRNNEDVMRNRKLLDELDDKPFNYCPPGQNMEEISELEEELEGIEFVCRNQSEFS